MTAVAVIHPLRLARENRGIGQAELARLARCSAPFLCQIEQGQRLPSVDLAERLAEVVGNTVAELFGEARPCPACGAPTFSPTCPKCIRRKTLDGPARLPAPRLRQHEAFLAFKHERGLYEAREVADEVGCSVGFVTKCHREGKVRGRLYRREWSGRRPYLYTRHKLELIRELYARSKAHRGAIARTRNIARGRSGADRHAAVSLVCPECGSTFEQLPSLLKGRDDPTCSPRCGNRQRWKKLHGIEGLILPIWKGRARQRWGGRIAARKPPAPGASPRGRPAVTPTENQQAEIKRLAAQGWGRRAIAGRLGVSERAVRNVLAA